MKKTNKIISTILVLVMLLTIIPAGMITVGAVPNSANIKVDSVSALPGTTVEVNVEIENNPGILGATLTLSYGEGLTLTGASQGMALDCLTMTKPGRFTSPCNFTWDGEEITDDQIKDGTILTLTFDVAEDVEAGTDLPVEISYEYGDVVDNSLSFVTLDIENGAVSVIDYTPGDVDGNGRVTSLDVIYVRRYIAGGYDVVINTLAANVNLDTKINSLDVIMMRRFIAGGYYGDYGPIELYASPVKHFHSLMYMSELECWYCTDCNKYFRDSKGEDEFDPFSCPVPITYHLFDGDAYLESVGVNNPNPDYYLLDKGLTLKNLTAEGYVFDGWYDGEGLNGELVKKIPVGATEEYNLYARWRPREYTITFISPLVPVAARKYTINTGATLPKLELSGYNFIGWCDENENLVTEIPVGTTGDKTLYANWTSKRNQTRPVTDLDDPIVIEDTDEGEILFAYEIGTVENVPIKAISDTYQSVGGMTQTYSAASSVNFDYSAANSIANMVSGISSDSKTWYFSDQWNFSLFISEPWMIEYAWSLEEAEGYCRFDDKYLLNSSSGGRRTHTTSYGISGVLIGGLYSTEYSYYEGKVYPEYEVFSNTYSAASAVQKASFAGEQINRSLDVKAIEQGEASSLMYSNAGADLSAILNNSGPISVNNNTSVWNTSDSFSTAQNAASDQSVLETLSRAITDSRGYGNDLYYSSGNNENPLFYTTNTENDRYPSVVCYNNSAIATNLTYIELGGDNEGYYRAVLAGTAHVYAVVGYDVADDAYFVFTFTVMDDETHTFIDYSKTTPSFDDYENGVLPFEIPYFVKDYTDSRTICSDGLSINQEGVITGYDGTDSIVFIPSYYRNSKIDGTHSSIKVTGISPSTFAGKDVEFVFLSSFIENIPANAFQNCTNLSGISAPGVTSIGKNAFKNCSSLRTFNVPASVKSIGEKAFDGVDEISVTASTTVDDDGNVVGSSVPGAINSSAKRIILDISDNPENMTGFEFNVPSNVEYFELRGHAKTYNNIKINSDAGTTVLNGLNLENTSGIPLKSSSTNITLNSSCLSSTDYTAVFTSDNTDISLNGDVRIASANGKAVVGKNMSFSGYDSWLASAMTVSGNLYSCGSVTGFDFLNLINGSIVHISEEKYEELIADTADP